MHNFPLELASNRIPDTSELRVEVHVTEGVDGDQWKIPFPFAKMVKRMSELLPIGHKTVNRI